jgi:succinate dehydrogenase / fumarate reductase cytochrome b subunit
MGITWGVWISPAAQKRASYVCAAGGMLLLIVGLSALVSAMRIDPNEARAIEDAIYNARVSAREIEPNEHKRSAAPAVENVVDEGDETKAAASSEH